MLGPGLAANLNGGEHHSPCHHTEMSQARADASCHTKYSPHIVEATGLNLKWMIS